MASLAASSSDGGRKRHIQGPALFKDAGSQVVIRNRNFIHFGYLSQSYPLPEKEKFLVSSGIGRLIPLGGPAAIARCIISIIIYSLNRVMSARPGPHVSYECSSIVPPRGAHSYTPRTIVFIASGRLQIASAFNGCPDFIFGSVAHTMSGVASGGLFRPQASTRLSISIYKAIFRNHSILAAIAAAVAPTLSFFCQLFYDLQSAKPLAGNCNAPHRQSSTEDFNIRRILAYVKT